MSVANINELFRILANGTLEEQYQSQLSLRYLGVDVDADEASPDQYRYRVRVPGVRSVLFIPVVSTALSPGSSEEQLSVSTHQSHDAWINLNRLVFALFPGNRIDHDQSSAEQHPGVQIMDPTIA
jgi:hypothetical protein